MAAKKVLFISGSLGLGHVVRDLAIAGALRRRQPDIEIFWLAAHPVDEYLRAHGEAMAAGAEHYANDNIAAESVACAGRLNLLAYLTKAKNQWRRNVEVFADITRRQRFDLVIGDETYEILVALSKKPELKQSPFVMIYDFVGLEAMSANPLEIMGIYMWNRVWSGSKAPVDLSLFVGEEEDVPDRSFGFLLPNRRQWARQRLQFIGQIVRFEPADLVDRKALRQKLGWGTGSWVVGTVGGSAAGKPLLELFGQAYPLLREKLPELHMVLVCGPRIAPETVNAPRGVEKVGFVPDLYNHFAACDLALVMGGGGSTLELTVLQRPFIYFPLSGHCEQERHVAPRIERSRAGVRMDFGRTTPASLAAAVVANWDRAVDYRPVRIGGENRAATLMQPLLDR
jgi:UDP:flavonoid glycosyltransferase YjiC (YdhE family)